MPRITIILLHNRGRFKVNVLITGNLGFLGKHLTRKLDKLAISWKGYDLPEHDVLNITEKDLKDVTHVVHLAAMKGIPQCENETVKAVETNILGTAKLLQACVNAQVDHFIYSSTWAVNSHNLKAYDVTKKASEDLVRHYTQRKRLNGCILRMATFYGKGMANDGVINRFIEAKKNNQVATIYGDGKETRQYTHVTDVINALVLLLHQTPTSIKPYVITANEHITVEKLAQKIGVSYKHEKEVFEPENYQTLNSKRLELLGWLQTVSLEEGLKEMMS